MDNYGVGKEEIDKYSLRGKVFNKIREDILAGNYKEKDELKEATISKELEVSRTPMREELCQLEMEGLVSIIPNQGICEWDYGEGYLCHSFLFGGALRKMGM